MLVSKQWKISAEFMQIGMVHDGSTASVHVDMITGNAFPEKLT